MSQFKSIPVIYDHDNEMNSNTDSFFGQADYGSLRITADHCGSLRITTDHCGSLRITSDPGAADPGAAKIADNRSRVLWEEAHESSNSNIHTSGREMCEYVVVRVNAGEAGKAPTASCD